METANVINYIALKNIGYVGAFVVGAEWLGFDPQSITILGALMLMDIITGICRVWMTEGGRNIKSGALKKGITAKFLVASGMFSIAIASKGVGFEMHQVANGCLMVLILGELYSILGNIHSARTGQKKVEFDAVAIILGKVKIILDKIVK